MTYLFPYVGDDRRRPRHPAHIAMERLARKEAAKKKAQAPLLVEASKSPEHDPNAPFSIDGMPPSLRQILAEVCREHQVTPFEVRSPDGRKHVVQARRVFCIRAREETKYTITKIGGCLNIDHTTVVYYLKQGHAGCSMAPILERSNRLPKTAQRVLKLVLSDQETRCLELYAGGLTTLEVAARMGISDSAARNTRGRASRKMALIKAKEARQ